VGPLPGNEELSLKAEPTHNRLRREPRQWELKWHHAEYIVCDERSPW